MVAEMNEYGGETITNMPKDYDAIVVGALITQYAIENGFAMFVNEKGQGRVCTVRPRRNRSEGDEEFSEADRN